MIKQTLLLAALATTASLGLADQASAQAARDQIRVLGRGRLVIAFLMTMFGYGGVFVAFTYLSPILQRITGFAETTVGLILVGFGIAIALGNILGGKVADRRPIRALIVMFALQAAVLAAFTVTAVSATLTLITLAAMGVLTFSTVPGLQLYVVELARRHAPSGAVDVASALNIAAFNLGIALGALIGGAVVESPLGLGATPWVGALLVLAGLGLTLWSGWLDRRQAAIPARAATIAC